MKLSFNKSLLLSLGLVMALITIMVFVSMLASLVIAETIQGQATAINEAGSLRMRSYRIATSLISDALDDKAHWQNTNQQMIEFEQHLRGDKLIRVLPKEKNSAIRKAYEKIDVQWQEEIQPVFEIYMDGILGLLPEASDRRGVISEDAVLNLRSHYSMIVESFVRNIDQFVLLLEQNAELKTKQLRMIQYSALLTTMLMSVVVLILVYQRVHKPLKELIIGAEFVRNGIFDFRIQNIGKDELGRLSHAFNIMAEDLSKTYQNLEDRVQQKTADLEQSNRSFELLYKTVRQLNESVHPDLVYDDILRDIDKLMGGMRGVICLRDTDKFNAVTLASTLHDADYSKILCKQPDCMNCMNKDGSQSIEVSNKHGDSKTIFITPISFKDHQYGILLVEQENGFAIELWQQQILEAISGHIGVAINISQRAAESRRLSLMDERSVIARELHDSLAQSLTFMKIQVSRLHQLLDEPDKRSDMHNIVGELRVGLQSAYRELRELLTTFRLKLDGKSFNQALEETVNEFEDRGNVKISCNNHINYSNLTPNEEINVLQVVREALSNVVYHSNASMANVDIRTDSAGNVHVCIEDDGIGLRNENSKVHHYGLTIMAERAKSLNGELKITGKTSSGVKVDLNFSPVNKIASLNISNE